MSRTVAAAALAVLVGACGGKSLDLGSPRDSGGPSGPSLPDPSQSTVLLAHRREVDSLFSEGPNLYWAAPKSADDKTREFWRCDKQDCAGTVRSISQLGVKLVIRNDTVYFAYQGGIASCAANGCTAPSQIVTKASGGPVLVDDASVYWATTNDNAFFSCPLTGCVEAVTTIASGLGLNLFLGVALNDANLYVAVVEPNTWDRYSISFAPKDGSAASKKLVGGLAAPATFIAQNDFVYWFAGRDKATLSRCPATGCPDSGPETLLTDQYFPHDLAFEGGVLFWINESNPVATLKEISRPIRIVACVASHCADSVAVLDEARGGSAIPPPNIMSFPTSLVVDEQAIYWFGDVVDVSTSTEILTESSIRRLARKPGK